MATQVVVPMLGESISEAKLVAWLKQVGDLVRRGDELAEIETAKATMPLECPLNGVLLAVLVEAGTDVQTGQVLAVVGKPGEKPIVEKAIETPVGLDLPLPEQVHVAEEIRLEDERRVSPAARRMAKELGVELSQVIPSTPGGRITTQDVERYLQASQAKGKPPEWLPHHREELSSVRKAVAERMTQSAQQIPQFSVSMDVLCRELIETKKRLAEQGIEASLTALLAQLVGRAIQKHPLVNAKYEEEAVVVYDTVNLAVAVATPTGLIAPVIYGVEKLGIKEIARTLEELARTAREGRLSMEQISKATFTLSNLGMHGVSQFVPLVNPPQAAILGVGAARTTLVLTPVGAIEPMPVLTLTVSADHRVLDGEGVAQFLISVQQEIENPKFIL